MEALKGQCPSQSLYTESLVKYVPDGAFMGSENEENNRLSRDSRGVNNSIHIEPNISGYVTHKELSAFGQQQKQQYII